MDRKSDFIFKYPPNLQQLDLATMVSMYRDRGNPVTAPPGTYLACAVSRKLVKEAKAWFGLHYSQASWDALITKSSEGYPLTEAELNALGLTLISADRPPHREVVETSLEVPQKLGYMIINDLQTFGFLIEDEQGTLAVTPRGERALQGICRRIYQKKFSPVMLATYREELHGNGGNSVQEQPRLF